MKIPGLPVTGELVAEVCNAEPCDMTQLPERLASEEIMLRYPKEARLLKAVHKKCQKQAEALPREGADFERVLLNLKMKSLEAHREISVRTGIKRAGHDPLQKIELRYDLELKDAVLVTEASGVPWNMRATGKKKKNKNK